tara:strand:+ start:1969 stop:2187 length:219 start_codon:yes stop_codon:yes gene_type:complete
MKNKTEFVRNIYAFEGTCKVLIEDNDEKINLLLSKNYTIKDVIISSEQNNKCSIGDTKQSIFVEIFILEKTL